MDLEGVDLNKQWNDLVEQHPVLLLDERFFAQQITEMLNHGQSPQHFFLLLVVAYHEGLKRSEGEKYWDMLHLEFLKFQTAEKVNPWLAFYLPNYRLLTGRRARKPFDDMKEECFKATTVIEVNEFSWRARAQLKGFLAYNWARYLLICASEHAKACEFFRLAAQHRITYYMAIREAPIMHPLRLKAAATQVWKVGFEWSHFFPEQRASCPVSAELFGEISDLVDPSFLHR